MTVRARFIVSVKGQTSNNFANSAFPGVLLVQQGMYVSRCGIQPSRVSFSVSSQCLSPFDGGMYLICPSLFFKVISFSIAACFANLKCLIKSLCLTFILFRLEWLSRSLS